MAAEPAISTADLTGWPIPDRPGSGPIGGIADSWIALRVSDR
jgi:hypothetical protein